VDGKRPYLTAEQRAYLGDIIEAEGLAQEAIFLWPMEKSRAQRVGWYGGLPSLPKGVDWPVSPLSREPVHFLFQVDMAKLPQCRHPHRQLLPEKGILMVFGGLTFPYVEDQVGLVDGLIYLVYAPEAGLDDPGRPIPKGMTSPFDEELGFADLEDGFTSPDGLQLPRVAMRACAAAEFRATTGMSPFRDDPEVAEAYEALVTYVSASEFADACADINTSPWGAGGGLNPYFVVKMLGDLQGYFNADGFSNNHSDGVRLFAMDLPPASGIKLGDPTVDIKMAPRDFEKQDFSRIRVVLDVS